MTDIFAKEGGSCALLYFGFQINAFISFDVQLNSTVLYCMILKDVYEWTSPNASDVWVA